MTSGSTYTKHIHCTVWHGDQSLGCREFPDLSSHVLVISGTILHISFMVHYMLTFVTPLTVLLVMQLTL